MLSKVNILQEIKENDNIVYTLNPSSEFEIPVKIYGDIDSKVNRVLKTFKDRDRNLGVLMSGIKGNSKTTTAKMICEKSNLPVILITQPHIGSEFHSLLASIQEEVIIFIDEFEKVYNTHDLQQEFLTILDGVIGGKKLFLFTSNSEKINPFLRNRPSRIYYHFKFDNLEQEVVDEIIKKELKNKKWEIELREILQMMGYFSIDVLLNYIDEINRFDISPKVLIKGLNIEVEHKDFQVLMFINGKRYTTTTRFNPVTSDTVTIDYKDENGVYKWKNIRLSDYVRFVQGRSYVYESKEDKYVFTPYKKTNFEL